MRKIFSMIFMIVILAGSILMIRNSHVDASDTWIYTNNSGTKYYLRDYGIAARSWCFAAVVTVDSRSNSTNLIYRFESGIDEYSVYYGTNSHDVVKRDSRCIEKGTISGNVVASIIWNKYVEPIDAERWARIREREGY